MMPVYRLAYRLAYIGVVMMTSRGSPVTRSRPRTVVSSVRRPEYTADGDFQIFRSFSPIKILNSL